MKLILKLVFILAIMIFSLKQVVSFSKNSQLDKLTMQTFGFGPKASMKLLLFELVERELREKALRKHEKMREQEEENRRKIINERLMPMTKWNSFMRDFYSGRY